MSIIIDEDSPEDIALSSSLKIKMSITVNDKNVINQLEIVDGLKELLIINGITLESTLFYYY
jgi:hypothetical protein